MIGYGALGAALVLLGCADDEVRPAGDTDATSVLDTADVNEFDAVDDTREFDTLDSGEVAPDATETVDTSDASETGDTGDAGDTAVTGDTGDTSDTPAALPPWLAYCEDTACDALGEVVLAVCGDGDPTCTPTRATTIRPSIDGRRVTAIAFLVSHPEGTQLRVVSGPASLGGPIVTAFAPTVTLLSEVDVRVSYYELTPVWGGITPLDFTSETRRADLMDSVFFRHPSYATGTAADELHTRGLATIDTQRELTGLSSEKVQAYFMPTELAAVQGEGNFSYGDGTITSNYGNPPYIAALGGIMAVAFPRFAHEYAHELFDEIRMAFTGNASCFNEGVADALAFTVGDLPEADFGPIGLRGDDFDDGCGALSEIHDVGNCYFWHVMRAGLLTPAFMRGIFHPAHSYDFDSCDQHLRHTGDTVLVYFTEAADGADMVPVVDAMGLDHAGSYAAALTALGFSR